MADPFRVVTGRLPPHEAERLATLVTGRSRARLASEPNLTPDEADRLRTLVHRRMSGEPLQYLEGDVVFGPVTLRVDRRALIPRPETEQLFEEVTQRLRQDAPSVVVDLGTGCGALALALRSAFPSADVYGTDIDAAALTLAAENEAATGLKVHWANGDLFEALPGALRGCVDLLISNPPYVADADAAALPQDVLQHEPAVALFGGRDGLDALRRIADGAADWLRPGGVVACEIGAEQGAAVRGLFSRYGADIGVDLAGRDLWVIGRSPASIRT